MMQAEERLRQLVPDRIMKLNIERPSSKVTKSPLLMIAGDGCRDSPRQLPERR
jgi:hypothetical protein